MEVLHLSINYNINIMQTKAKNIYCLSYRDSTNLGDEVQTLAAINVLKKLGLKCEGFVDRDYPAVTKQVNLLVNGFIQQQNIAGKTQNDKINPIFNNFHLNHIDQRTLAKSLEQLKKHSPIGCRDRWTYDLLKKHGVDAFFNHCLTLTFDRRKNEPENGKVFVVDLDSFVPIPKEIKRKGLHYVSQEAVNNYSHDTKMRMAQELLDRYRAEASLVITSKLHCALPCVAMGIPVILFGNHEEPRLKLAEEVIPVHPYVVLDDVYTNMKLLPYIKLFRIKYFVKRLLKKVKWHIKYRHHLKHKIDWNPQPIDIEELKETIINNTGKQLQTLAK